MRGRGLVTFVTLTLVVCFLFPAGHVLASMRTTDLNRREHSLPLSKAMPNTLSYQGYLIDAYDSLAVTAMLAMTFQLFDSETKGAELWAETHPTVEVNDGLFQVLLGSITSFPINLFDGNSLWLQTEIGTETLSPRKPLVSTAYSQRSGDADHATTAEWASDAQHAIYADTADYGISGGGWTVDGDNVYRMTGKVGIGTASPLTELDVSGSVNAATYYGDGSNLTGISGAADDDWVVSGNVLHPADGYGLSMRSSNVLHGWNDSTHVNFGIACTTGTSGQHYQFCTVGGGRNNTASGFWTTVAGGRYNAAIGNDATVSGGSYNTSAWGGATVGGGVWHEASGYYATVGGGEANAASDGYATVAGGSRDTVKAPYGGVAAGYSNLAGGIAADTAAFVGGGYDNSAAARCATVGGGKSNTASGIYATVGGGEFNTASGTNATVGGGEDNTSNNNYATVGGGYGNTASGYMATVSGGYSNTASGQQAVVAGGTGNDSDGDHSFTVGYYSDVPSSYFNSAAFNGQTATASSQTRVGTLSKSSGTFTIDHPTEPMNRILNHYFVESPEMVLIYRGAAFISSDGRAEVHLPDYFDALNRNPMVQLTGVGTSDVYVAEKVTGNRFVIGGKPNTEVYWTVTGDRKDPSAEITRILMPVEQLKEGDLTGHSLDDDFLATTMDQLERMGQTGKFSFRTQAGREKYERSRQALENPDQMGPGRRD
ncbi:hypothetical protein ACFL0G_04850 [Candidatus Zixiibacteriota bacterium]